MSDTIHAIVVEIDEGWRDDAETLVHVYAVDSHQSTEFTLPLADVIELTEERFDVNSWTGAIGQPQVRRLVTELETVDDE